MSELVGDRLFGMTNVVGDIPPFIPSTHILPGDDDSRIHCAGCGQPIKGDELGGVGRGDAENNGEIWFHDAPQCMIKAADLMVADHKHSLRTIARRMQGKPEKEETHGEKTKHKHRGGFNALGF